MYLCSCFYGLYVIQLSCYFRKNMPKYGFTQEEISKWHDKSYLLEGSRRTGIVLVHGWTAMPRQLRDLADILHEAGFWVYVPRLSGHGTYPEDLEDLKAEEWVDDVVRAIDKLKRRDEINKVFVAGISLGGNLATLAALQIRINGLILISTPFYLKKHFWIWFVSHFVVFVKKYSKKKYKKGVNVGMMEATSYQYFPIANIRQCLKIMRKFRAALRKIKTPTLILQVQGDYMIAPYSPWRIYRKIKSKTKKLRWIESANNCHVPFSEEMPELIEPFLKFIQEVERQEKLNN